MLYMECWMTGCGVGFMVHISVRLHSSISVFNNSLWLVDIANYSHIIRPLNVIVIILLHLRHRELTSFKYFSNVTLVVLKWSSNFTRWYILKISSFPPKSIELRPIDKNPILVWSWYCPNQKWKNSNKTPSMQRVQGNHIGIKISLLHSIKVASVETERRE